MENRYFDATDLDEDAFNEYCDADLTYIGNRTDENSLDYQFCTRMTSTMWRPYEEATMSASKPGHFTDAYWTSLYWALLVVIGNSVEPTNRIEYMFSLITTLVGMLVFAVIIGSSSSLITSLDSEGEARLEQMNAINQYMAFRGVPQWLQNRVRAYYEYLWHSGQANHHKKAFDELPPMLQMQLSLCLKRSMIENCSVFKNLSAGSVVAIMNRLEEVIAIPGEVIILQGSIGDKMFFISNGTVLVNLQKGGGEIIKLAEMNRGAAFGEMGVLESQGNIRSCSIVAKSFCELNVLNKADIDQIRVECADVDENLQAILAERRAADKAREDAREENEGGDDEDGGMGGEGGGGEDGDGDGDKDKDLNGSFRNKFSRRITKAVSYVKSLINLSRSMGLIEESEDEDSDEDSDEEGDEDEDGDGGAMRSGGDSECESSSPNGGLSATELMKLGKNEGSEKKGGRESQLLAVGKLSGSLGSSLGLGPLKKKRRKSKGIGFHGIDDVKKEEELKQRISKLEVEIENATENNDKETVRRLTISLDKKKKKISEFAKKRRERKSKGGSPKGSSPKNTIARRKAAFRKTGSGEGGNSK